MDKDKLLVMKLPKKKEKEGQKKVMVFGTFDILHPGHLNCFKQAYKSGDYLIVVVARDKNVIKDKGRKPKYDEKTRLKRLQKLKGVDKVFLGYINNRFKIIDKVKPDIICFGYDQKVSGDLKEKIKKKGIKTKKLKPYMAEKYKSSLLR